MKFKAALSAVVSIALAIAFVPMCPCDANAKSQSSTYLPEVSAKYNNKPTSILDGKDKKGAYGIFYDDGELLLQRGNTPNASKKASGAHVVAVYTGIETGTTESTLEGFVRIAQTGFTAYTETGVYSRLWSSWDDRGECDDITRVRVLDKIKPKTTCGWFQSCETLESCDLTKLDTSDVYSMDFMFYSCHWLEELDLSNFNTKNVTSMNCMFSSCDFLKTLNVSHFDTSKVEDMGFMFDGCSSLSELDLSSFKTPKLKTMSGMFDGCAARTLDLRGFDTRNIREDDLTAFGGCERLECVMWGSDYAGNVPVEAPYATSVFGGDWQWHDTAGNTYLRELPAGAGTYYAYPSTSAEDLTSQLDGSDTANAYAVYYQDGTLLLQRGNKADAARKAQGLAVAEFGIIGETAENPYMYGASFKYTVESVVVADPIKPYSIDDWFNGMRFVKKMDLNKLDTRSLTSLRGAFLGCEHLEELDLSGWNTSNVVDTSSMFNGCTRLKVLDLSCLKATHATNAKSMFNGCESLKGLDISMLDTSKATNLSNMFAGCRRLVSIGTDTIDCSSATDIAMMFASSPLAGSLDMSKLHTGKATDMTGLFSGCPLRTINLHGLDTSHVKYMDFMFHDCKKLKAVDLSPLKTNTLKSMMGMFCGCASLTEIDLSPLDTSNVEYMCFPTNYSLSADSHISTILFSNGGLFTECSSLERINLAGLDTSKVKDMSFMFDGCESLTSLDLSRFDTSNTECMVAMFQGCTSLESVNISSFNTSDLDKFQFVKDESQFSTQSRSNGKAQKTARYLSPMAKGSGLTDNDVFYGCDSLARITVGKKFAFKDSSMRLPAQRNASLAGADGKWHTASGKSYKPAKVPSKKAATYYALAPIGKAKVTNVWNLSYTGKARTQTPRVKVGTTVLKKGTDYKLTYKNNKKVGKATMIITGKGSRAGTKKVTFKVMPANTSIKKAKVGGLKAKVYTGKAQKQKPVVKLGKKTLKANRDYKLTYEKNTNAGTAKVIIHGVGKYSDPKAATFKIAKAANTLKAAGKTVTVKGSAVKKSAQVVAAQKAFSVKKAHGDIAFKKTKGNSKIVVASDGTVTLKKGLDKGTYSVNVVVKARGDNNWKPTTSTVALTVRVR